MSFPVPIFLIVWILVSFQINGDDQVKMLDQSDKISSRGKNGRLTESISDAKLGVRSKTYSLGNGWSQGIMVKATIIVNELEHMLRKVIQWKENVSVYLTMQSFN